ncbi:major facilitator superfamily domain-containing protein [Dipodascopsis tothii]|uniref:major facilitator superfamily domain-containing protein n=1 Tax=Dipodascopsis tothii TaxID=44089 RepID=UPI0034D02250
MGKASDPAGRNRDRGILRELATPRQDQTGWTTAARLHNWRSSRSLLLVRDSKTSQRIMWSPRANQLDPIADHPLSPVGGGENDGVGLSQSPASGRTLAGSLPAAKLFSSAASSTYTTDRVSPPSTVYSDDDLDLELDDQRSLGSAADISTQAGVQRLAVLSHTWTRRALYTAYIGLLSLAFMMSLATQTTSILTPFATSEFHLHSLLATVQVVQGILFAVVKAPIAKIANTFGRMEAFMFALSLYTLGFVQMAFSGSVGAYISSQIFSASGTTGLLTLQQIFVADTTDLLNRALFSVLPDLPFLATVWLGPGIANVVTLNFSWRWGYGIFIFLVPVACSPLLATLWFNQRRAAKLGVLPEYPWQGVCDPWSRAKAVFFELDVVGMLLFAAGFALILIPLTISHTPLAGGAQFGSPPIVGMLVAGVVLTGFFFFWESQPALAPRPLLNLRVLRNRTIACGCILILFYDMAFNIFQPYFFSFLIVSRAPDVTTASAGRVVQAFSFSSTVSAILVSLVIKYSSKYKPWVLVGVPVYIGGIITMHVTRGSGTASLLQLAFSQVLAGVGGGLISVPTQLGVQAACTVVPVTDANSAPGARAFATHQDIAPVTALFLTVFSVGSAIGAAISGALWTSLLPAALRRNLPDTAQDMLDQIYGDIEFARHAFEQQPELRAKLVDAYEHVMSVLVWAALAVAACAFVAALGMKNYNLAELSLQDMDSSEEAVEDVVRRQHKASVRSSLENSALMMVGSEAIIIGGRAPSAAGSRAGSEARDDDDFDANESASSSFLR